MAHEQRPAFPTHCVSTTYCPLRSARPLRPWARTMSPGQRPPSSRRRLRQLEPPYVAQSRSGFGRRRTCPASASPRLQCSAPVPAGLVSARGRLWARRHGSGRPSLNTPPGRKSWGLLAGKRREFLPMRPSFSWKPKNPRNWKGVQQAGCHGLHVGTKDTRGSTSSWES